MILGYCQKCFVKGTGLSNFQDLKLNSQPLSRNLGLFYPRLLFRIGRIRKDRDAGDFGKSLLE